MAAEAPRGPALAAQRLEGIGETLNLSLGEVQKGGDAGHSAGQSLEAALTGETPISAPPAVEAPQAPKPSRLKRIIRSTPYLTLGLIAANSALYQNELVSVFDPKSPSIASAVHSIFSHADPNHIGRNMMMILMFGAALELFTKRRPTMMAVYLAAGLVPLIARAAGLMDPVVSLGASAAMSGLAGAFVVSLWRAPRTMWDFLGYMIGAVAVQWFGQELTMSIAAIPGDKTDHIAHVLGFLAGGVIGWKRLRVPPPSAS